MRRFAQNGEPHYPCAHERKPYTSQFGGVHDCLEIVNINGIDYVRRCGTLPCNEHVDAIRRAREALGLGA